MGLSDRAVINCINGLFGKAYDPDSELSRPATETVEPTLKRSFADMVLCINGTDAYLIEAQIKNDTDMALRILQYMLNQGRREAVKKGHALSIRLPETRVIYWEITGTSPDLERIYFEFPGGLRCCYEAPSFKFPNYTAAILEERNMGLLLPFCVLKLRREVKKAKSSAARQDLAKQLKRIVEDVMAAVERSEERGILNSWDGENLRRLTLRLQQEIYSPYTEFAEVLSMWEDIQLIDYEGIIRRAEEADQRAEAAEAAAAQKMKAAAQRLIAMGISEEQLAAAGLLEIAGK
jgi:hypothetical protein